MQIAATGLPRKIAQMIAAQMGCIEKIHDSCHPFVCLAQPMLESKGFLQNPQSEERSAEPAPVKGQREALRGVQKGFRMLLPYLCSHNI